jgi:DNA-binding MarR family transcriptional regulator
MSVSATDQARERPRVVAKEAGRTLDQGRLQRLIGYNLRRAELQMRGNVARLLGGEGLRAVEYSILSLVANNHEVTQKDLGESLSVKRPNMVSLIERLEARGLIERAVMARDRRNHALSVTPAGREMLATLDARLDALEEEVFSAWSAAERAQFATFLRRVHASGQDG